MSFDLSHRTHPYGVIGQVNNVVVSFDVSHLLSVLAPSFCPLHLHAVIGPLSDGGHVI